MNWNDSTYWIDSPVRYDFNDLIDSTDQNDTDFNDSSDRNDYDWNNSTDQNHSTDLNDWNHYDYMMFKEVLNGIILLIRIILMIMIQLIMT